MGTYICIVIAYMTGAMTEFGRQQRWQAWVFIPVISAFLMVLVLIEFGH